MSDSTETLAWVDQGGEEWVSISALAIPVQDIGVRQGAIAVERLRTYGGRVFELPDYLARWRRTLEHLKILLPTDPLVAAESIQRVIDRNRDWCASVGDFGITMLATPGRVDRPRSKPTHIIHLNPLDPAATRKRRLKGEPLVITDVQQPSARCWPRDIKVRCRLHYFAADLAARQLTPGALGVLIDEDGSITDTSIANVVIVRDGKVYSPTASQVLPGVTQGVVRQLADKLGLTWKHETIFPAELRNADEVWLMGTDNGLWFADRVDGAPIAEGRPGPIYLRMLAEFDRYVAAHSEGQPRPMQPSVTASHAKPQVKIAGDSQRGS